MADHDNFGAGFAQFCDFDMDFGDERTGGVEDAKFTLFGLGLQRF